VAVLDLDFAARPFPGVGALFASADELTKLRAICVLCGEEASRSQRLVDGLPALMTTPLLAIESGTIEYQARCRSCYRAPSA
jgi:thymidine kinase